MALAGTIGTVWSGGIRDRYSDERIAENEAETARAKEETAKALLEQSRLKREMAWRTVTMDQAVKLSDALKGGPNELWLSWVGDDPEATWFRDNLHHVLSNAGVKTKFFSGYSRAVNLSVKGGTFEERKFIAEAFQAAGIPCVVTNDRGHFGEDLEILVGTKPPPMFQGL